MKKKKIVWIPTCKRFVAYLDIMGFRDMVFRNTHEEVLQIMERFRLPIGKLKQEAQERLRGEPTGWNIFESSVIRPVIFSDSVLLFSNDDSAASLENMLWQVESVITHALVNNIPIKGAISFGEQTASFGKSLYFGKPLIDAWELQNEILIYGAILHHTVENYLVENSLMDDFDQINIVNYPVPLRQGKISHYLVDWVELTSVAMPKRALEIENSLPHLYCKVSGNARRYVDNTIEFFNWKKEDLNKRKNESEKKRR